MGRDATAVTTPTQGLDPPQTPTTQPPPCIEEAGRIVVEELNDPELPRSLPYRIYLPPCYPALKSRGLPTVYLLHGLQRTDEQWDALGADEMAAEVIASGEAPAFLLVMPWERKGLDFETAVVSHLLPHIEASYGAKPSRSGRAIGGISRGAGWALRIGFKHPELFASVGLHSPAVLVPDLFNLPDWVEPAGGQLPRLWIDVGERDPLRASVEELAQLLHSLEVSYEFQTFTGEHSAAYWSSNMQAYIRWYGSGFGP